MKQLLKYLKESAQSASKPKDKKELQQIIIERIKKDGPECDLNDIDVSKITDMSNLFDATINKIFKDFNGNISMWDVSNVKCMYSMFYDCDKFNCDLSKWDVSNVEDMGIMFWGCKKFNCDLSKWNVSNVKFMYRIFSGCKTFMQNLDSWNVSKVEEMQYAFYKCPTRPDWYIINKK